jgi:hypothetical protein
MKVARSQWILVTAACLIVAASAAQSEDRPPGADGNNWVPISDTAGILLTKFDPSGVTRQREFDDVETIVPMSGTGVLMVKFGGIWMRVDLAPPRARVQPLY